ncbi:MAG: hypothetical protein KJP14_00010 [Eudoraea sp.]|nr:hypothetical protein [Eudoraea sp.]MBT8208890.1 hypothetical protein [Eudoraea sp.]MBT8221832.1 hypothetical protein [Eudoraea sp.]NNK31165.1 hypothetical protein [Flavobacteriaceae bacterium]
MQTLSRYFVAFLLLLVSSFLEDSEPEKETQQASVEHIEIILEQPSASEKDARRLYRCS